MTTLKRAFGAMAPSTNARAIWRLVLACLGAIASVILATTTAPATTWEWIRFIGGITGAVVLIFERTWAPYPGNDIDQRSYG